MKKVFTLLLTLIALTASAQTSMHIYMGSSHYIYETEQIDSIIFIDNLANPLGDGTLESPYNVAGVLKAGSQLADLDTLESVYVKGYVIRLQSAPLTQYGNASYYLSDSKEVTNRFYVYRGYSLGNQPFATDDELELGDEVVVCGQLINYEGETVELTGSFIYSINGESYVDLRKGDGTLENPFNTVAAAAYARSFGTDTPSDQAVYIKGKVASISEPFSINYGNSTFYISDDGTMNNAFYVYRTLYLGNRKFKEGDTQIQEGDEVILYGKVINWRGTIPETIQGETFLYSLNEMTEGTSELPSTNSLDINFKAGQGDWVIKNATALPSGLNYVWQQTTQYGMKASAYVSGTRYATDSWLISPAINLSANGTLTFSQTQRYGSGNDLHVMMSTTYDGGDIDPTQWTELNVDQWPDGSSWTFITSKAPVAAGNNIRIAFRYTSSTSAAATWEIESANVK